MNMLFKNTTKYSKECYENFLIFHNKKFGVSSNFYTLLIVILMAFCIVLQLKAGNTQLVFIFILTLICFLLWRIFHPIKEVKDEFESKKIQKESTFIFRFYEKYFTISDGTQTDKYYYWKLYKVFNTKDYYYFYLDRKYAFLINKNGFTLGNEKDFSNFIKTKCLFRYKTENM